MSGRPRSELGGWLRALVLAFLIAAYSGGVVWSVCVLLWLRDVCERNCCEPIAACVSLLAFFVALPMCWRDARRWLSRLPRARRVSLWLFWGTLLLFAVSQISVTVHAGWSVAGLSPGEIGLVVYREPPEVTRSVIWGCQTHELDWVPAIAKTTADWAEFLVVLVPLWVVGVAVLWPWWNPPILWLLGGGVPGHRPPGSWHYRLALTALLCSGMLCALSLQDLKVWYGRSCLAELVLGRVIWHHDSMETEYRWPPEWKLRGYPIAGPCGSWRLPQGATVRHRDIPLWPLVVACSFWLAVAIRPRHRFRRRWEDGLCLHCGYDLRGLKERCTECGQPIEPERLAMLAWDGGQPETETPGGDIESQTHGGEGRR